MMTQITVLSCSLHDRFLISHLAVIVFDVHSTASILSQHVDTICDLAQIIQYIYEYWSKKRGKLANNAGKALLHR